MNRSHGSQSTGGARVCRAGPCMQSTAHACQRAVHPCIHAAPSSSTVHASRSPQPECKQTLLPTRHTPLLLADPSLPLQPTTRAAASRRSHWRCSSVAHSHSGYMRRGLVVRWDACPSCSPGCAVTHGQGTVRDAGDGRGRGVGGTLVRTMGAGVGMMPAASSFTTSSGCSLASHTSCSAMHQCQSPPSCNLAPRARLGRRRQVHTLAELTCGIISGDYAVSSRLMRIHRHTHPRATNV